MQILSPIEKRIPWSLLGFVLGAISLIIAIWFFYLSKQRDVTDVKFYVEDENPLVELKEEFPNLKVLYNNEDILQSEKEIKIIRIRIVNGGRTILQSYFDQRLPFGLEFQKSTILAISPATSSGDYLRENLFPEARKEDLKIGKLLLNKPIIDEEAWLTFKVYLLQEKGLNTTTIESFGKISGMDHIPVIPFDPTAMSERGSARDFGEIIGIGFVAGYVGILVLTLTLVAVISFSELHKKRIREKLCQEFLDERKDLTDDQKKLVKGYAEGWRYYHLRTIKSLLRGERAMDIGDLIEQNIKKVQKWGLFYPFVLSRFRSMRPLRWDPAIFVVSDRMISLNEKNKEVLNSLLKKCKEIRKN